MSTSSRDRLQTPHHTELKRKKMDLRTYMIECAEAKSLENNNALVSKYLNSTVR